LDGGVITNARFVSLSIRDQQKALEFFRDLLGFEVLVDQPMGEEQGGPRWIEVCPPDGQTHVVLFAPDEQQDRVGGFSNVWFDCDDLDRTYQELSARGVEFPVPPSVADWDPSSRWAQFKDPDGNLYGLSQRS
jgi:uncharacterized glyoxalase superfamily protein PhnB